MISFNLEFCATLNSMLMVAASQVEQEKLGTAEDQNAMFARLAGRVSAREVDQLFSCKHT